MTGPRTPSPPSPLRIGHLAYAVSIDTAAVDRDAAEAASGRRSGASHSASQYIRLIDDLAPDYAAEVLLHEILHQCLSVTATDLDELASAGVRDLEERAVAAMAGPLLAVLRDNPDLLPYLLAPGGMVD